MKILHTSDWHLGRTLYGEHREGVFAAFLDWMIGTLRTQQVDALIVAGDIFDSTIPPVTAQKLYYSFLARVGRETPCRDVIVVGGNHDSPQLLNAPKTLLDALGIHVVGKAGDNPADEVVPLRDEKGDVTALVLAVPFLREGDLHQLSEEDLKADREARIIGETKAHYQKVFDTACALYPQALSLPLIATGHLFAAGGTAGKSERDLYVGSLGAVPEDVFPAKADYLALGHLHRAQVLSDNVAHAYSGSPIALDFSEGQTEHFVNLVTFSGKTPAVTPLPVPAFDRLVHIEGNRDEILAAVKALTESGTDNPVLVEAVHTGLGAAETLAAAAGELTQNTPVRVVRIIDRTRVEAVLKGSAELRDVHELTADEVFSLRLKAEDDMTPETAERLTAAYREILHRLQTKEG